NHHGLCRLVGRVDQGLLLVNTLLLGGIAFLPFPTAVVAAQLRRGGTDQRTALLFYGGSLVLVALLYNLFWHYARLRGLLRPGLDPRVVRTVNRRFLLGPPAYAAASAFTLVVPLLALALWVGLAVVYLLLSYRPDPEPSR